MMIDFKSCSEEDLWKYVAGHLERRGFDVVLVGGGVVSVYSEGAYKSGDLDFIVRSFNKKEIPRVLAEIGFIKTPQRFYTHPECHHLFIEFPTGPLEIAQDLNIQPLEIEHEGQKIKIISPTDCVLDRLEQFFVVEYGKPHGERKLFEQAVLVGRKQEVSLHEIEKFCKSQNKEDVFLDFLEEIKKS